MNTQTPVLYCTILFCTLLYYNYSTVLYYIVLYCTTLYYTVLYSSVLYYIVLYYIVLYCTTLYYTVLYSSVLYWPVQCTLRHPCCWGWHVGTGVAPPWKCFHPLLPTKSPAQTPSPVLVKLKYSPLEFRAMETVHLERLGDPRGSKSTTTLLSIYILRMMMVGHDFI